MTNVLLCSLRGVETVRIGFLVSLTTLVINTCLNYILIYGHFGAPRLGVRGAAIATLAARAVECLVTILYVRFRDKKLSFRLADVFRLDKGIGRDYFRSGAPVILSNASWGFCHGDPDGYIGASRQNSGDGQQHCHHGISDFDSSQLTVRPAHRRS